MKARRLAVFSAALALSAGALAPPATAVEVPVLSANVDLVASIPTAAPAISAAFDPSRPYMYVSTMHGIDVYDIRVPESPELVGSVPIVVYQNENVSMGLTAARRGGRTFVLIGTDYIGAVTPTDPEASDVVPDADIYINHLYVVDVTDPGDPFLRSHLDGIRTNTHTVSCLSKDCPYAYTAGNNTHFSVIDLKNLDRPKEVAVLPNPWKWHDWQVDSAGVLWQTADEGTAAFDITNPLKPKVLNSTSKLALSGGPWNQFIHHNSARPYAKRFPKGSGPRRGTPSVFRGDVVLVTEEFVKEGYCGDESALQTWHVPSLRKGDTKGGKPGGGTMRPLDIWRSTVPGTDQPSLVGSDCSAHYFDFHQSGFVAQAWYSNGIRILDVRNARDIKQVGYLMLPDMRAWSAYWVPKRDKKGRVVMGPHGEAARTNLVYSTDYRRGLDVLRVTLPKTSAKSTRTLPSPNVSGLLWPATAASVVPASPFACRATA